MASPFTVFRKNQKVLLAITGILAMIAFVFLGTCIQAPSGAQARENPAVVSWKFGDITEAEMASRLSMRRILNHFLRGAMAAAGRPVNDQMQFFAETEDSVIRSMVLARRGREMGLVISDDMVNRELAQLTNNSVPPSTLERLVADFRLESGQRMTPKQLFDALRQEMLARHVAMLFLDGLGAEGQSLIPALDTPAQRWNYFRRLERQVRAQVLALPVDRFVAEVGKPSDEELRALFDKHKQDLPSPQSPEPGFRQPYRARFEYFKSDIEAMVTAEMEKVTDEEVRQYYEKNKDTQFRKAKLSPLDQSGAKTEPTQNSTKAPDQSGKAAPDNAVKPAGDQSATGDAGKAARANPQKPSETTAPEPNAKSGDEKPADSKPQPTSGDDAKKPQDLSTPGATEGDDKETAEPSEPAKTSDAPDASKKTSATASQSPFRLVNYQDEKAPKTEETKAPDTKTPDTKTPDTKTPDTKTPDTKTPDTKTPDTKTPDTKTPDTKTPDTKTPATQTPAATPPAPVEYRPLDQVRDEIRRTLARERLQKDIDQRFASLRTELLKYGDQRMRWQRESARDPSVKQPAPLDLSALAAKYGLKSFKTDLISRVQAANSPDLDIAKSIDFAVRTQANPFGADWLTVAFEKGTLYKPRTSESLGGDRFLWWKVEEKPGHTPEFEQVRDQVLEAWKRIQARDIAKKKAEAYAKTVRDAKQPMKAVFAQENDLSVKEIGPFSWLTRLNVPFNMSQQMPSVHYPDIEGVESPGEAFMETTFHLQPNEVGVAFNQPQSAVYVIQPQNFEPSDTVLEQEFMAQMKNYDRFRSAGIEETSQAQNDWMQSLFSEYEVRWHRPADLRRES